MGTETSINVPEYDPSKGVVSSSEGGELAVAVDGSGVVVSGDPAGLRDLARWCLAVANAQAGSHVHLDPGVDLSRESASLVVELTES
ncbi:MAG TPA: hypothetical protein VII96_11255 [Acidimicrobiales bacterium]